MSKHIIIGWGLVDKDDGTLEELPVNLVRLGDSEAVRSVMMPSLYSCRQDARNARLYGGEIAGYLDTAVRVKVTVEVTT